MPDEKTPATTHGDDAVRDAASKPYPRARKMAVRYGGNPWAALEIVGKENEKYRERFRAVAEGKELKFEPDLPEGSVVLTLADAQAWNAFRAIGKSPTEIVQAIQTGEAAAKERDSLKQTVTDHELEKVRDEAAQIVGYKPSVLGKELKDRNVAIEFGDADVPTTNGKTERKRIPFAVVGEGKDAKKEPLTAYAERELLDYMPALKADAAPSQGTSRTLYPEQKPTGMAHSGGDKVGQHIAATNQRNAERPNPLRPKVATA